MLKRYFNYSTFKKKCLTGWLKLPISCIVLELLALGRDRVAARVVHLDGQLELQDETQTAVELPALVDDPDAVLGAA